jgi:protein required for attachment to host cells
MVNSGNARPRENLRKLARGARRTYLMIVNMPRMNGWIRQKYV